MKGRGTDSRYRAFCHAYRFPRQISSYRQVDELSTVFQTRMKGDFRCCSQPMIRIPATYTVSGGSRFARPKMTLYVRSISPQTTGCMQLIDRQQRHHKPEVCPPRSTLKLWYSSTQPGVSGHCANDIIKANGHERMPSTLLCIIAASALESYRRSGFRVSPTRGI